MAFKMLPLHSKYITGRHEYSVNAIYIKYIKRILNFLAHVECQGLKQALAAECPVRSATK